MKRMMILGTSECAVLDALRRHLVTRRHDRLLISELEAAWTHEIGQHGRELHDTIRHLGREGLFQLHDTPAGEALELTAQGAREVCHPSVQQPATRPTPWPTRLREGLRTLLVRLADVGDDESTPPLGIAVRFEALPITVTTRPRHHRA